MTYRGMQHISRSVIKDVRLIWWATHEPLLLDPLTTVHAVLQILAGDIII